MTRVALFLETKVFLGRSPDSPANIILLSFHHCYPGCSTFVLIVLVVIPSSFSGLRYRSHHSCAYPTIVLPVLPLSFRRRVYDQPLVVSAGYSATVLPAAIPPPLDLRFLLRHRGGGVLSGAIRVGVFLRR